MAFAHWLHIAMGRGGNVQLGELSRNATSDRQGHDPGEVAIRYSN